MSQMLRITLRFKKADVPWESWMSENNPLLPDWSEYQKQLQFANTFSNVLANEYHHYLDIEVEDEDFFIDETLNVSGRDDERVKEIVHDLWRETSSFFPVDAHVQFIERTPMERYEFKESEYDEFAGENVEHVQPSN